jgi:four helix bundle protein
MGSRGSFRRLNCELKTTCRVLSAGRLVAAGLGSDQNDVEANEIGRELREMSDFKKLHVWQKAHALSLSIDRMCKRIGGSRHASLRSQVFRAAMSISANIAEGRSKNSDKDFGRFLGYALSSCTEVEHHLIVARDTRVIPESEFVSFDQSDHYSAEDALRPLETPFDHRARFDGKKKHVREKLAATSRPADSTRQVVFSCS